MDRRGFIKVTVPTLLGLASGIELHAQAATSSSWTLGSGKLRIDLSAETKGALSGFTDIQSQRNFIAKPGPVYQLLLVRKGQQPIELTSLDAEGVNVTQSSDHNLQSLALNLR
jgi:hypothetical protein